MYHISYFLKFDENFFKHPTLFSDLAPVRLSDPIQKSCFDYMERRCKLEMQK